MADAEPEDAAPPSGEAEARGDDDEDGRPLLSEQVAMDTWYDAVERTKHLPSSKDPVLVQFAGIPLSGKSTVARAFVEDAPSAVVHAENDALRARIAARLGRPPQHDRFEHFVTYHAAWTLCGMALDGGLHVVHDATNLDEGGRRKGYETADAAGARVFVVFVTTDRDVLEARAAQVSEDRQGAHRKYRNRQPDPEACTRPHIVLDGALEVEKNLERLRAEPHLRAVYHPG